MMAHNGCFEDASAVIDTCSPCSVMHAACLSFEVYHVFSGQSVLWDQRVTARSLFLTPMFLTQKITVMHWSEPKSYNKPFELLCPRILALGASDLDIGTLSCQSRLLMVTLQPFSLLFNVQVMIPVGSWVFQPCLGICRQVLPQHQHPLWHVGKRLGNKVSA